MVSAGSLSLGSPEAGLGMKSHTTDVLMARSQETRAGSLEETSQGCDGVQFLYDPRGRSGVRAQTAPYEVAPTPRKSARAAGGKWRPVP